MAGAELVNDRRRPMRRLLHGLICAIAVPLYRFACWLFGVADRIWWDEGEPVIEWPESHIWTGDNTTTTATSGSTVTWTMTGGGADA